MSTLSLRLPESLHRKLAEVAEREGVSLNQLISSAAAEKLAALMTEEYLAARAKRASRRKFDAVLARVPGLPPAAGDEVPPEYATSTPGGRRANKALQRTGRKASRR